MLQDFQKNQAREIAEATERTRRKLEEEQDKTISLNTQLNALKVRLILRKVVCLTVHCKEYLLESFLSSVGNIAMMKNILMLVFCFTAWMSHVQERTNFMKIKS